MTTNMHELGHLMGFGHSGTTRSVRTYQEPSDTVSGKSGSQLLLQWTEVRIVGLDGRGEEVVVSTSSTGYVGRLVAFVDMKVDELLNDDMPSRNQHWQRQSKCLCSVQPEKSPLTTELGKRPTKSLWCSKRDPRHRVRNAWRSRRGR
jgi:hypothetical protein